jgi:hypothetical protein
MHIGRMLMAATSQDRTPTSGARPIHDSDDAAKVGEESIKAPRAGKTTGGKPTGADQAAANREVDPPA